MAHEELNAAPRPHTQTSRSRAASVADELGFDWLTLASLANRFGVTVPSLYKHVNGIDGLKRDLAVLAVRELTAAMSRAAVGRAGRDALHAIANATATTRRPTRPLRRERTRTDGRGHRAHQGKRSVAGRLPGRARGLRNRRRCQQVRSDARPQEVGGAEGGELGRGRDRRDPLTAGRDPRLRDP